MSTSLTFNESNFVTLTDYTTDTLKQVPVEYRVDTSLFAVRTCQSYFQPHVTIQYSNIGPFIEGMAAGATELEDFIITPDLRGQVKCLLVLCDITSRFTVGMIWIGIRTVGFLSKRLDGN